MNHVAIMKKSWGLIPKIVSGEKTVESRWYRNKSTPWGKIKRGDTIYFKNSGEPITLKTEVSKVLQSAGLTQKKTKEILKKYGKADLGTSKIIPEIKKYVSDKKYCILIFLKNPKKVKPFNINKKGFGAMSAWICVDDIRKIRK